MLEIKNLHATVDNKAILKGLNLSVKAGEVHAIMGPNGAGKSTLANLLAGADAYAVTEGSAEFQGQDLLALSPDERARLGLFLGFQYPIEIPGISNIYFLKTAYNIMRKARGEAELDAMDFNQLVKSKLSAVGMDQDLLYRSLNEGFSGGEKKRNEILQMLLLEPRLAMLDETDSGLDIDALKMIAKGIETLKSPDRSFVVITHYARLLEQIKPTHVHILAGGQIIKSGGLEIAKRLEQEGYDNVQAEAA